MAFTPIYNVRLEIDCSRLRPECMLELITPEGTSIPGGDRPLLDKFFSEVAGAFMQSSLPSVLSFDINDHVRPHLTFLKSHPRSVKEAAEYDAIRLILPHDSGQWMHPLNPGLSAVVASYGVRIETDSREE
jgi:hypothetical protein